ncbi:L-threonylcarbamoyladenylate synthase [Kitasatospora sp. MAP12-15]|uniref:Sua5/YciO/YrdC/YwlC family protein n=1 Tax=unclassified Kitasatospora TaxID=2633591 RepID=UPI0024735D1D|nr:Sua5/YciO/YrdC/YwlC family protein [Kitasatospora sp. MAP12-44]MDH6108198.1 L-threonylcarbamoyladenylate synthase [Kitasatospora sp. MAP12-44]
MRVLAEAEALQTVAALDAGKIVVLPTRRWYMLCADSTNAEACRMLFEGKGRPATKPLALVMASDAAVAARFSFSGQARRLAEGLWPGDLALLLPWLTPESAQDRGWLGTRTAMVTRDPGPLGEVAAWTRNPPAVTVVSRSDGRDAVERQPALSPVEVRRFVERTAMPVEILVDGGVCPLGRGLTVVDCSSAPRLVREGAVHARAVSQALDVPASEF